MIGELGFVELNYKVDQLMSLFFNVVFVVQILKVVYDVVQEEEDEILNFFEGEGEENVVVDKLMELFVKKGKSDDLIVLFCV